MFNVDYPIFRVVLIEFLCTCIFYNIRYFPVGKGHILSAVLQDPLSVSERQFFQYILWIEVLMKTLKKAILNLDAIITCITLSLCTILVNCNIFTRYLFNSPIYWAEEVATSLFIWTVFIGSAYAFRTKAHLGVDVLVKMLPPKSKKVVNLLIDLIEIAVLIMLTYVSAQYVMNSWHRVTDVLMMPRWYFAIAVPIGFGWSLLYAIYFFILDLTGKAGKEEKSNGA